MLYSIFILICTLFMISGCQKNDSHMVNPLEGDTDAKSSQEIEKLVTQLEHFNVTDLERLLKQAGGFGEEDYKHLQEMCNDIKCGAEHIGPILHRFDKEKLLTAANFRKIETLYSNGINIYFLKDLFEKFDRAQLLTQPNFDQCILMISSACNLDLGLVNEGFAALLDNKLLNQSNFNSLFDQPIKQAQKLDIVCDMFCTLDNSELLSSNNKEGLSIFNIVMKYYAAFTSKALMDIGLIMQTLWNINPALLTLLLDNTNVLLHDRVQNLETIFGFVMRRILEKNVTNEQGISDLRSILCSLSKIRGVETHFTESTLQNLLFDFVTVGSIHEKNTQALKEVLLHFSNLLEQYDAALILDLVKTIQSTCRLYGGRSICPAVEFKDTLHIMQRSGLLIDTNFELICRAFCTVPHGEDYYKNRVMSYDWAWGYGDIKDIMQTLESANLFTQDNFDFLHTKFFTQKNFYTCHEGYTTSVCDSTLLKWSLRELQREGKLTQDSFKEVINNYKLFQLQ